MLAASERLAERNCEPDRTANAISTALSGFESILQKARAPVLQELIAQVIVYWRAFLKSLPSYTEPDSYSYGVAGNFGSAVTFMCSAVPLTPDRGDRTQGVTTSTVGDLTRLEPFMMRADAKCADFISMSETQDAIPRGWLDTDPTVPASEWTPEVRSLNMAVQEVLNRDAKRAREIASGTKNGIFSDLLTTYADYVQAYADAIPVYVPDENQLWRVTTFLAGGLSAACKAR